MVKNWFPLESNPDVVNDYVDKMGLNVDEWWFQDVYSVEDWALDMVPQPVVAVLLLYPVKPTTEEFTKLQESKVKEHGQEVSSNVYFMKQVVENACGTIGILHGVGNAKNSVEIRKNSYLDRFYSSTCSCAPDVIGDKLNNDEEIECFHTEAAEDGQSVHRECDSDSHFVCFSNVDGAIYELDGRKAFPINHGPSTSETFLKDASRIIQEFMDLFHSGALQTKP